MNKKDFNKNGYPFTTAEGAKLAYMVAVLEDSNIQIYNYINGLELDLQIAAINDMVKAVKSVDFNRGSRYGKTIKRWAERKNIIIKTTEGKIFGWSKGIAVLKDSDKRSETSAANGKNISLSEAITPPPAASTPPPAPAAAPAPAASTPPPPPAEPAPITIDVTPTNVDVTPVIVDLNDDDDDDDEHKLTVDEAFEQLIEQLSFSQLIVLTDKLNKFTTTEKATG